jgi:hypothetical protein
MLCGTERKIAVAHVCNPATQESEVGESRPKANLGKIMRAYLKNN